MTTTNENETEWIQLAREGDQAAFGRLVGAYQTPVYNLAYRMLGDAAEAEEAAQETFLRAYKYLHSYDPKRPFSSWLLSIASNYCIDRLRRRRITWLPFQDELAAPVHVTSSPGNPEAIVERHEQKEEIQRLLEALSPTDRAAVTLRYWYDYSYEEIAENLDLTVSAIKSRLYRARRTLADMMEGGTDNAL